MSEIANRTPQQELVAFVRQPQFQEQVALALPEGVAPQRFVRIAVTALVENPDLAAAERNSVVNSLLKAAADGLLPDGREAALVLFKRKGSDVKDAAYLPMVGGFRKIAADHGWSLEARAVFEHDAFDYTLGDQPFVAHRPPLGEPNRGKLVAAYAVATELDTGRKIVEVMNAGEIEKVRQKAARSQAIWNDWTPQMYAKTAARRLFKSLPLGDRERVKRVLAADELGTGEAASLVYGSAAAGDAAAPAALRVGAAEGPSEGPAEGADQTAAAPSAPFTGAEPEPPAAAESGDAEAEVADFTFGEEWEGTRYHGKTLADVVEAGDVGYLDWLASEAIADAELRKMAAAAREKVKS